MEKLSHHQSYKGKGVSVRTRKENNMLGGFTASNTNLKSRTSPPSRYSYSPKRERYFKQVTNNKSSKKTWWNDAERKRKLRVAQYKLYATEATIKKSFTKAIRWFKIKCKIGNH